MTSITKKTLTLASLLLMTSGGVRGDCPIYANDGDLSLHNGNFQGRKDPQINNDTSRFGPLPSDSGFETDSNSDAQSQTPQTRRVCKTKSQRDLERSERLSSPNFESFSRVSPNQTQTNLDNLYKEVGNKTISENTRESVRDSDHEQSISSSSQADHSEIKLAQKKAHKALRFVIDRPGFVEKVKGFLENKTTPENKELAKTMYQKFTDYLIENPKIKEKDIINLFDDDLLKLNVTEQTAWSNIIHKDARAITSKWVYEGNKNFTPRNAAVFAVNQLINTKNLNNFQNVLFEGQGHKKFKKHLIIQLKKQAPKQDIVWKSLLDIAPTFDPQNNSTETENLKTFTEIMCSGGAKIFKGFVIHEGQHKSKKQQWAEALLQRKDYKPTVAQRIFRQLTPLENILIQSMVNLAKEKHWENLNQRIVWLGALAGDKPENILGQVYQKINREALLEISEDARTVFSQTPDAKKGIKQKA